MTLEEVHLKNFEQFMDDINEKIRADLLVERQKIVAFNASEASTNLLEHYLHKKKFISTGFHMNHNYFASEKRASRYLDFNFPKKLEIIKLMVNQEEFRNLLCYGKGKEKNIIEEAILNLNKIVKLIKEELSKNETK